MNTTTEILTVNGVVLNTLAKNITTLAGRLHVAGLRTENVKVPGRHGSIRTPNKVFDENILVLPMWVEGCDDDGRIPTGSTKRIEFYKRVDELTELFKGGSSILDIRHTLPDGTIRQIFGDVMDVFDFTTTAAPSGQFTVNITCPDPFWQDVNAKSQTLSVAGTTATAGSFSKSTAPMEEMAYVLTGPWTNPQLTFSDGSWVAYDVALLAGQTVTIDSGEWELTGGGGHTVDYTKLRHDGADSRWATLPSGSQLVTIGGTARTGASGLVLTGRQKYLVG